MTQDASRDTVLALRWHCGTAGHGNCFSSDHISAGQVAAETAGHTRDCGCWRHAVLRAIGWPSVTGEPDGRPAVLADPALPHQIMLLLPSAAAAAGKIAVSCNCLARPAGTGAGRGRPREIIDARLEFPAAEARAVYARWHADRGIEVG
jgi:hypothetical protein